MEKNIIYISSKDDFLRSNKIKFVKNDICKKKNLESFELDFKNYYSGLVLEKLSPSLFSNDSLIIVENAYNISDIELFIEDLQNFIKSNNKSSYLIIGDNKKKRKLANFVTKNKADIEVIEINDVMNFSQKQNFVTQYCKERKTKISSENIRLLLNYTEDDTSILVGTLNQLIGECESGQITTKQIETLISNSTLNTSTFKIADFVTCGDVKNSILEIRHAIKENISYIQIVNSLAYKIRQIANISIGNTKGIQPWAINNIKRILPLWNKETYKYAVETIYSCDKKLKTSADTDSIEEDIISIARRVQRNKIRFNR